MLVFSGTHLFIDLCASKVRYYREGGGGGGGVQEGSHLAVKQPKISYHASSGFSRPDITLRRKRNHCQQPSASFMKPPSSAMDKKLTLNM